LRVHLTPGPTHSKGVFALPSSAVLKPAQAGLVEFDSTFYSNFPNI
jgi:hypothetical protein